MRRKAVVLVLIVASAVSATAFDQRRQGFILGGGVGGGLVSFTQTIEGGGSSITSPRENDPALRTDFKIGGGLNEQVLLYWSSRVSWFSLENILGDKVTIANSVAGVGLSYYFTPETQTAYLTGSVGFSSWMLPFEPAASTWYGMGGTAGIGYEFSRAWSFEVVATLGNPSDSEGGLTATTNAVGVSVTINGLAY